MNGKIQANSGDVSIIAIKVDGAVVDEIPAKGSGKYFESAECSNGATGSWDRTNWQFLLNTTKKTKCTLNFTTTKSTTGEQSGASKMEDLLSQEEDKGSGITIVSDDNNIRYIGQNPSNYIYFNCKDSTTQNAENCETWRIIGLMDGIKTKAGKTERLLKIIREKLPVSLSWDSSASSVNQGYGVNEWSQADLMTVLNGDYFKGQKGTDKCYSSSGVSTTDCPDWIQYGLKKSAQDMIEEVVWNTGTAAVTENTWEKGNMPVVQYIWERSDFTGKQCNGGSYCNDDVQRQTTWEGKVGLMYPSDYGYATDGGKDQVKRMQCLYTPLYDWNDNSNCYSNDWLYDSQNYQWTMTPAPYSSYASAVFIVHAIGRVYYRNAYNANAARPVVYLKSSVKITGGTGSDSDPFQLKLEE